MATAPTIELKNGVAMPLIGLGTYPLDDRQVAEAVVAATGIGYRLIDTSAKYGNESGVGDGIRACRVPREELFVTTKLDGGYQGDDRAIPGLDASLGRLRLDYVDLAADPLAAAVARPVRRYLDDVRDDPGVRKGRSDRGVEFPPGAP
jgi:2,5-diketo-D-gluconate reductase A